MLQRERKPNKMTKQRVTKLFIKKKSLSFSILVFLLLFAQKNNKICYLFSFKPFFLGIFLGDFPLFLSGK